MLLFHFPISIFKKPSRIFKIGKILDQLIDEIRNDEDHPLAEVCKLLVKFRTAR